jgi:hypothetical protein
MKVICRSYNMNLQNDTLAARKFMLDAHDYEIWHPITEDEKNDFLVLVEDVEYKMENGSKKEKGDALEELMTFIYERFQIAYVEPNVMIGDNQIDHIITFVDSFLPPFLYHNIGSRIVGESKNHKDSIGVREVADLMELLRSKNSKLGIFSSYKSFSRGRNKNPWINAEGKRRKLALASNYEKLIIGFTLDELRSLVTNNFYTLLKRKYYSLIDELDDDTTDFPDDDFLKPYHERYYQTLCEMLEGDLISQKAFEQTVKRIEERHGPIPTILIGNSEPQ